VVAYGSPGKVGAGGVALGNKAAPFTLPPALCPSKFTCHQMVPLLAAQPPPAGPSVEQWPGCKQLVTAHIWLDFMLCLSFLL
jgi:hypothetical protein